MSEPQTPEVQVVTAPISEEAFLETQRLAIASNERIELARVDAHKEVALSQTAEQRRVIAMNCALASYGLGAQSLNPPANKPDTNDILRRAASIDTFIHSGQTPNTLTAALSDAPAPTAA